MNPKNHTSADVWLPAKVRGLVTAIGTFVFVGGQFGLVFYVLPAAGVDPNSDVSFTSQPAVAFGIVASALTAIFVFAYMGAIVAAAVAVLIFPVASVRAECLWFLWFPGLRAVNARLFDRLFNTKTG